MGKNRITIDFKGFEEYAAKLDELGGSNALRQGVEAGLKASKQLVNKQLKQAIKKSNLPKSGTYSTGRTEKSISKDFSVVWEGDTAVIKIGFEFSKSGLTSIMLMYGTPKMPKVAGLWEAVYGNSTKNKMRQMQQEALDKVIKRIMEG